MPEPAEPSTGTARNDDLRTVGVGLLGCADIATRRILPTLAGIAGARLTAVASRDPVKAADVARRYGGEPVHGYQHLLDRDDVAAVYLPLPAALHATWIRRALLSGKHVLAEKPLTTSHAETAELVDLAARHGLVLQENYMFPWHSQHTAIRTLLAEGTIGDPQLFTATFAIPPRPEGDIRLRPELGGGALLDTAGYPLRAALLTLGRELTVAGAALRQDSRTGVDLGGGILLHRADGVTAHLSFGLAHGYVSQLEVIGSSGSIRVEHVFTTPPAHCPVVTVERGGARERHPLAPDDQCRNALTAFVAAIRARRVTSHGDTLAHALIVDRARTMASQVTAG
ncbi:Gfo/Idh/MocA family oxidoreductase [Frankia sp. AiPs1]|uniref:Gfo/Idh/MocA family protein n=1 Tax=Frankia sp. AiPs1 TaxID=573493 RepID=UPI002043B870|nr:Gfo/Idh/MocA family oxidoreductase [Frankia sp. AiPs1]MCM3920970.1 Gfo/Idh/MocA family oxidoreductase [Frankia sp. AiPs1]